MKHTLHPNASKSKKRIFIATFELMQEKPYEDIRIKEIAERAQVVRQTFYRNFDSKDDVIRSYLNFTVEQIIKRLAKLESLDTYTFALAMISYHREHRRVIELIFKNNLSGHMHDAHVGMIKILLNDNTPLCRKICLPNNPYATEFLIGAMIGTIKQWTESGMKESPEKIAYYWCDMYKD